MGAALCVLPDCLEAEGSTGAEGQGAEGQRDGTGDRQAVTFGEVPRVKVCSRPVGEPGKRCSAGGVGFQMFGTAPALILHMRARSGLGRSAGFFEKA